VLIWAVPLTAQALYTRSRGERELRRDGPGSSRAAIPIRATPLTSASSPACLARAVEAYPAAIAAAPSSSPLCSSSTTTAI